LIRSNSAAATASGGEPSREKRPRPEAEIGLGDPEGVRGGGASAREDSSREGNGADEGSASLQERRRFETR
jgi:hypothetical protein